MRIGTSLSEPDSDEATVAAQITTLADYGVTEFVASEYASRGERQRTRDLLKTLIAG
jgi:hypothetical protein